jgi:hypothetical protein
LRACTDEIAVLDHASDNVVPTLTTVAITRLIDVLTGRGCRFRDSRVDRDSLGRSGSRGRGEAKARTSRGVAGRDRRRTGSAGLGCIEWHLGGLNSHIGGTRRVDSGVGVSIVGCLSPVCCKSKVLISVIASTYLAGGYTVAVWKSAQSV